MISYLGAGKRIGAKQRCRNTIQKYCKEKYGRYGSDKIFEDSYNFRSAVTHGDKQPDINKYHAANYVKYLVLDILRAKMRQGAIGK
jgi:hypothetical protein